jgi:hypothetical protein
LSKVRLANVYYVLRRHGLFEIDALSILIDTQIVGIKFKWTIGPANLNFSNLNIEAQFGKDDLPRCAGEKLQPSGLRNIEPPY